MFLCCFWAYVGQPHNHIGWAISMPFATINSTNPRTNPWNFHKKFWELVILKNALFLSLPFWIFFFAFFQRNLVIVYWLARMAQNFNQAKRDNTFWTTPNILGGSVLLVHTFLELDDSALWFCDWNKDYSDKAEVQNIWECIICPTWLEY